MALSKILPASQEQYAGARNLIINGAMQVAQRGTSFTATGYSLDHWYVSEGGTCTLTQDTADVPANFKYAAKVVTSASSSFMALYQPFEAVDYEAFKNKTVTISFYAKANATFSGTFFVDIANGDTADTLLSGTWANNDPQYFNLTTSWARYTATIAVGSSNGIRLQMSPSAVQASGAEYSITGVQLEVGEATPFEHRSYGDELARCQRYYERSYRNNVYYMNNSSGAQIQRQAHYFQVQKRAAPTVTQTKTTGSGGSTVGNVGTALDGVTFSFSGGDNDTCFFSWTADAEL